MSGVPKTRVGSDLGGHYKNETAISNGRDIRLLLNDMISTVSAKFTE